MIEAANAGLAVACCLVLTGAVAKMDKRTCHSIRFGVICLFAGLVAEPLSFVFRGWDVWADTLLYVGIIAFAIGNKRGLPRMPWS